MINTKLTLLSAGNLTKYYRSGHWRDETIYDVARRHAEFAPGNFAVRDRYRRLTYQQLVEAADRLAADLQGRGLRQGQRIAVWLPNRVETVIALLACSRNAYTCCPSLHRTHTIDETMKLLERIRAASLIVETGYGADGDRYDISSEINRLTVAPHVYSLKPLTAEDSMRAPFADVLVDAHTVEIVEPEKVDSNSIVYIAFTSGTTGMPKGVMHSDNTLLANARTIAADWNFGRESVIYTLSPLSHNLGFGAMVAALAVGGELVQSDLGRGESLVDDLTASGASFLYGVPAHAVDLVNEIRIRGAKALSKIRGFRISGAAIAPSVAAELIEYGLMLQTGYGMTEACSHNYTLPDDPPERVIATSGRSCSGYELKIWSVDDPDTEAPPGEIGQIGGRGASLMLGYFDDQIATENAFNTSGWFMSGDLGWLDDDGYLHITGRLKDVIIRGGHKIFPLRIEELALRHGEIEAAAAVPVADRRLGEKVCLVIKRRTGSRAEPLQLLKHLDAQGLSKYDMPEYLIEVDEMPRTSSGKILKRKLLDAIQQGRLQPRAVDERPQA